MQINRLVVSGRADQRDHALRLAERIRADEMRALGKQFDRAQQLGDLGIRIAVAKHREPEGRLGDEGIAPDRLERRASRVGHILVVARCDHARAVCGDANLCRAKHMPGRMERHLDAAELQLFSVGDRLRRSGKILAIA